MAVQLNPYISFKGNAREAMEFYKTVFGGKLDISTFKDFGGAQSPADEELVMHSQLEGDSGIIFMASDTPSGMEYKPGTNMSMSLSGPEEVTLKDYFEKLSDGGTVTMPLEKAPWGDHFGMCIDKFGVTWLVNIGQPAK